MDDDAIEVDGFLADSVVGVQGKLYVLGAGWNRITASLFPARHDRIAIGLLVRLPAGAERRGRRFELRVVGPDDEVLVLAAGAEGPIDAITGEFTAGGPEEQVVPLALNLNGLGLPRPGDHRIEVTVDGRPVKRLPFRVQALADRPSTTHEPGTGTAGYL
ncbi:MAG TPA: hypothetical protein VFK59_12910 [Actinomycetota bacterium]|nr:hypothetical protein [Actinomycetota bacterium]